MKIANRKLRCEFRIKKNSEAKGCSEAVTARMRKIAVVTCAFVCGEDCVTKVVVLLLQITRGNEAQCNDFQHRNELSSDYDVQSSTGRGGLHFGSPAALFLRCRLTG